MDEAERGVAMKEKGKQERRGWFCALRAGGKQVQQRAHEQHRSERQPRVALLTANSRFQAPRRTKTPRRTMAASQEAMTAMVGKRRP